MLRTCPRGAYIPVRHMGNKQVNRCDVSGYDKFYKEKEGSER